MIEEYVQKIVEANWDNKQALVYRFAQELQQLRSALPAPAYLDRVAFELEMICVQEVDLPDGTTFDGPLFLRQAAQAVRLAIIDEAEEEREARGAANTVRLIAFLDESEGEHDAR